MNNLYDSLLDDILNCEKDYDLEPEMLTSKDISGYMAHGWAFTWFPSRKDTSVESDKILYMEHFRAALKAKKESEEFYNKLIEEGKIIVTNTRTN